MKNLLIIIITSTSTKVKFFLTFRFSSPVSKELKLRISVLWIPGLFIESFVNINIQFLRVWARFDNEFLTLYPGIPCNTWMPIILVFNDLALLLSAFSNQTDFILYKILSNFGKKKKTLYEVTDHFISF